MNDPVKQKRTYGYLALVQLLASAATDQRLTNAQRQALNVLARFAGADGTCCVSLARVAQLLDVKRQPVQRGLWAAERCGYLTSERRYRTTGAEGAKMFTFNLALEGALACPVPCRRGVHHLEGAGGRTSQVVQGVHLQEGAHNKPTKVTKVKETNSYSANVRTDRGQRDGKTAGGKTSDWRSGQQPLILPFASGGRASPPGKRLRQRVQAHIQKCQREASGRMWGRWCRLDPDLVLLGRLGKGQDKVIAKAQDLEAEKYGQGCRYIAGAIERATAGAVTACGILSGHYSPQAATLSRSEVSD